jgi:hypothetical protein
MHLLPRHTICRFQLVELRVERCSLRRVLCAAPNALARLAHHDSSMQLKPCHTCQLRLCSLVLVARHLKLSTKGPNHLMSSGFA